MPPNRGESARRCKTGNLRDDAGLSDYTGRIEARHLLRASSRCDRTQTDCNACAGRNARKAYQGDAIDLVEISKPEYGLATFPIPGPERRKL